VKRLILLLIVVAGGLAAAAFAVPTNAATVNGVAITQNQLNSDLAAIANSSGGLYGCYLKAEEAVASGGETTGAAPVDGVGQVSAGGQYSSASTAFAATYLDTDIGHDLLLQVAAARHVDVTPAEITAAHTQLESQITGILQDVEGTKFACGSSTTAITGAQVLATMPASFVSENVRFDAAATVLEEDLSGYGASTADLERYFEAHRASFDTACFTVAGYSTESEATAAAATVTATNTFAKVASAASGGPEGCGILYEVTSELPTGNGLATLAVNTVSKPIADNGEYVLVEITSKSPSPFSQAKSAVQVAEQSAGATATRDALNAREKRAAISVDARYGKWDPDVAEVLPPATPGSNDVLDPAVNGPAAVSTSSTGQTP
jgi:PPIC-type PPIASE domain